MRLERPLCLGQLEVGQVAVFSGQLAQGLLADDGAHGVIGRDSFGRGDIDAQPALACKQYKGGLHADQTHEVLWPGALGSL